MRSSSAPKERVFVSPESDARAIEVAQAVVEAMGGWESWDATRYVKWRFFGGRLHYWDRMTGDVRIGNIQLKDPDTEEQHEYLILMNVDSRAGRVWRDGQELSDNEELELWLERGHQIWINDSYWMFMPYKLLDPGVTLRYVGVGEMEDGGQAEVLDLTFDDVGYTPENRYRVYVAGDSGMVEQWDFYNSATDEEPRFKMPWKGWQSFGGIRLATDHGRGNDWEIAVLDEVPRSVFESPAPPTP